MNKEKIKLYNRYGANIWLEHIDEDLWQLRSQKVSDLEYMRVGRDDDNKIEFIDPSGGPFLNIGYELEWYDNQYKITEIFPNGFIIRLTKI